MTFFDLINGGSVPAALYIAAIGNFDGIHTAHRLLLDRARALSKEYKAISAAISFEDLPTPGLLCTKEQKMRRFADAGLDRAAFCDFIKIRNMEPEDFVTKILVPSGLKGIVCGFNFRFGKSACASADDLIFLCEKQGIFTEVIPPVRIDGEVVSSSLIRNAVTSGNIEKANRLLGYAFEIENVIEPGRAVGHRLGYPTLNQKLPDGFVVPAPGVYFSECRIDGILYNAVTNIGYRPTFGEGALSVESHLLGADGDFYGKNCKTSLLRFLRGETKFSSTDGLKTQIEQDVSSAKEYFSK